MATKTTNINGLLLSEYKQDPRILMALSTMKEGSSMAPVHTPMEGVARALQGALGGYMAGQMRDEYTGKQTQAFGAIADILAKPTIEQGSEIPGTAPLGDGSTLNYSTPSFVETPNPNREKIMAALQGGMIKPDAFSKQVAQNLGFGEASEYDTTPRYDQSGRAFVTSKTGDIKYLDGVSARDEMKVNNNVAYNPYTIQPGEQLPDTMSPAAEAQKARIAQAGRAVTNVNNNMGPNGIDYGKPDDGLVWQRSPDGKVVLDNRGAPIAIPYQGGKPYIQQSKEGAADANRKAQALLSSDVVVQDVTRLLDLGKKHSVAGFWGSKLANVAGTPQHDARSLTDTIKANVAFDKLQRMREASPTGGALGSVSAPELNLLQSALGNLEQSQSQEQYDFNVRRVRDIYVDTVHGPGTAKRLFPDEPAKGNARAGTAKGVSWRVVD